jgi:excisionase family DNA binding protein
MDKIVLTPPEVAKMLRISVMTVYRLAKKGDLPAKKVGKYWRFPKFAIEKWLLRENWEQRLDKLVSKIWSKTDKIPVRKIEGEIERAVSETRMS